MQHQGDNGGSESDTSVSDLSHRWEQYMAESGLRTTSKRRLIVHHFFNAHAHISLDELLGVVNRDDPAIGYATVYRTMKMLVKSGLAAEYSFGDGFTRFEPVHQDAHHDHLICIECGQIQEFEEPMIEELQRRVAAQLNFRILDHKCELYGICSRHDKKQA
jgi:Fur family ferric uptake transcriptional regulator